MQTLCAMAHYDYKKPGVYGYEDAFEIMRRLNLPKAQAIQLFRRMVFNLIARNQDDHTKNISFLMDKNGQWKLSPAYDMTYAYNPSGIWTNSHQMTVQGKRDNITKQDLMAVAQHINYKNGLDDIQHISDTVANWSEYSEEAGISKRQYRALARAFRII